MKTPETRPTSIRKVRRNELGGKRGMGHELQKQGRRVRRPDARKILTGDPDDSLTGVAGLVGFGRFARDIGLDQELGERFGDMKFGPYVVYPMGMQLRLLLQATTRPARILNRKTPSDALSVNGFAAGR